MSSGQVSQVSDKDGVVRPTAEFPPDIWGDCFLNYNYEEDKIDHVRREEEIEELKEQVRMELQSIVNNPLSKQNNLVDIVERLGVERHFKTEIKHVLQHIYDTYYHDIDHPYDLCMTALSFRLLRQHGKSKWLQDNRFPTFEEYMHVALVSVGHAYTIIMVFTTLDCLITKEVLDYTLSRPRLIIATELISKHIPSSVECYMKQYGVSEEEAHEELIKQIDDSWKDVNEDCLNFTPCPRSLIKIMLDFTRMTHLIYDGNNNFTRVGKQMQAHIASLLIDPVPILLTKSYAFETHPCLFH
ncbi:hypothetical protein ACOSP7_017448 [Xanthoceras sorbifolium]